jgi:hypothetical protein
MAPPPLVHHSRDFPDSCPRKIMLLIAISRPIADLRPPLIELSFCAGDDLRLEPAGGLRAGRRDVEAGVGSLLDINTARRLHCCISSHQLICPTLHAPYTPITYTQSFINLNTFLRQDEELHGPELSARHSGCRCTPQRARHCPRWCLYRRHQARG